MACDRISDEIKSPDSRPSWGNGLPDILFRKPGHPEVIEAVEIKAARGGICIASKQSNAADYYMAYGRIIYDKQITGEWHSTLGSGDSKGLFILTVNPRGNVMYGYYTAPNENNAIVYTTWVLAKNDGEDERKIKERLLWAEKQLEQMTITLPLSVE